VAGFASPGKDAENDGEEEFGSLDVSGESSMTNFSAIPRKA
jgi:hypothetical protein